MIQNVTVAVLNDVSEAKRNAKIIFISTFMYDLAAFEWSTVSIFADVAVIEM